MYTGTGGTRGAGDGAQVKLGADDLACSSGSLVHSRRASCTRGLAMRDTTRVQALVKTWAKMHKMHVCDDEEETAYATMQDEVGMCK